MKKTLIWIALVISFVMQTACEDKPLGPIKQDNVPPGPVVIKSVTPVPGGFEVSYDLPGDDDLLYVKAEYFIREGQKSEAKSSLYLNHLIVTGFGDTLSKTVKLYAVDRSANVSPSVEFTDSPLEAPGSAIQKTLKLEPDFGGVKFTWINSSEAPVSIMLYAEDSTGIFEHVHTVYTSVDTGRYSLRGYDPVPRRFSALVRDRWDNLSDHKYPDTPDSTLTPFYEARLDKTKFRKVLLPNDTDWDAWEGKFEFGYDDDFQSFVHSQGDHAMPQIMTIDLGVKVRLSRFVVNQRGLEQSFWAYTHGNPLTYDIYGSMGLGDGTGNLDDWIKLMECTSVKPSGLPIGQNSDEDMIHFFAGDEYSFQTPVEIRYFRFAVMSTWDGAGFINFSELTFWGDIIEEYN
ncbi:MAG: DUF5000 domain-containing lipoprotein [Bacteroidota bacterium]|nr:DUF5000 domain-containing lipoprotein [Bacteroidota bacterium]